MHRRSFLLSASLLPQLRSFATAEVAALSLGFSLYGMRAIKLDEAIDACAKVGYDAVEIAAMPDWPGDPIKLSKDDRKRMKDQLAHRKLSLPALMENLPFEVDAEKGKVQLDRLKRAMELANDLAPNAPPMIETILGGKPGEFEKVKEPLLERLGQWEKLAAANRVVIAVKPHRMGMFHLPDDAVDLIKKINSKFLRLAFDWSHFEQREWKMTDIVEKLVPLSGFIHVKDTILEKAKDKEQVRFVLPGEGKTDYPALLAAISKAGYRGCVCIEVSGMVSNKKGYDPIAAATQCHGTLREAMRSK